MAIAARVAAVLVLRNHEVPRSTYEHGEIAANLLAGRGFSIRFLGADGPTSQQAPVYPIIVAAAYAVGGVGDAAGPAAAGAGTVRPGRLPRLGRPAALAAGRAGPSADRGDGGTDRRPPPDARLRRDPRAGRRPGGDPARLDARLGLSNREHREAARRRDHRRVWLALLALTDPILSLAIVGDRVGASQQAYAGRLASPCSWPRCTMLVALVGISPWLVRNYRVHGEFVAIKSTFGYAFWQGNCALSEGTDKVRRASVESILRRGQGGIDPERLEPGTLGRPPRGRLHRRHRADARRTSRWLGTLLGARAIADPLPSGAGRPRGRPLAISPALPAAAALFRALRRDESQVAGAGLSGLAHRADRPRDRRTVPGRARAANAG